MPKLGSHQADLVWGGNFLEDWLIQVIVYNSNNLLANSMLVFAETALIICEGHDRASTRRVRKIFENFPQQLMKIFGLFLQDVLFGVIAEDLNSLFLQADINISIVLNDTAIYDFLARTLIAINNWKWGIKILLTIREETNSRIRISKWFWKKPCEQVDCECQDKGILANEYHFFLKQNECENIDKGVKRKMA